MYTFLPSLMYEALPSLSVICAAGVLFSPILNPVGHHSTNETLLFCFNHCTVEFASLDLISPR